LVTVLLGALAAGGTLVGIALAKNDVPPAPTITSGPVSPTNQTSATFVYTDSQAVTKFQCSLDGSSYTDCGTTRPSSKAYTGLPGGSHTFQVRAVSGSQTSGSTASSWTIDLTPPTVSSIIRADASPTKAASVRWTVVFSEAVAGVAANGGNFSLATSGVTGSPAITGVTGSGSTYTVTATTGTDTTGPTGMLQLNLTAAGAITDAAGNGLAAVPASGQAYTIDKTAPPAPSITDHPPAVTNDKNAHFKFTDAEGGVSFACALDGGSRAACQSPQNYNNLPDGKHTVCVQGVDAPGNVSARTCLTWTIQQNWSIAGGPLPGVLVYPGGSDVPLDLVFSDPGSTQLTVTSVTTSITSTSSGACATSNFTIAQQLTGPVTVPANSAMSLQQLGLPQSSWPKLRMIDTHVNQDACKNVTVNLSYSGQAQ
jgi:hypothetical protein